MSLDITQDILTQAVAEVTEEYGRVNLSTLGRRLPLTREQLKRLKRNGFIIKPNGNLGKHREKTKLSGFEEIIDSYLMNISGYFEPPVRSSRATVPVGAEP